MDYSRQSDEELMRLFCEVFDETAFGVLVHRYHRSAFVLARTYLHCKADAEDAVQEAFSRIVRQCDRYDQNRPFRPWFFQVLRNVCLDCRRRIVRRSRKLAEFADYADSEVSRVVRPGLFELIDTLSSEDRELLVLRFVQGLSFREISEQLACSEDAAKKRGQRALARLRRASAEDDSRANHGVSSLSEQRKKQFQGRRDDSIQSSVLPSLCSLQDFVG